MIARYCVFGDDQDPDHVGQRRAFHGVTIVNVGSVDFAPYITLLLSSVNGCRLLDRLMVVTDRDPDPELPKKRRRKRGRENNQRMKANSLPEKMKLRATTAPRTGPE